MKDVTAPGDLRKEAYICIASPIFASNEKDNRRRCKIRHEENGSRQTGGEEIRREENYSR
ncbi:hypothetical protein EG028_17875 [Chitinophaga barathri]|uniref:Uncharacterized protein n=1 Tax=Chitinophaga barathri TaxID=1647451 RepID=A0A3N4MK83_9BACT|nr:hypothetical protein EG028_17875 [Chitinophaga barathri]